ncbi:MAG TPA: ATP-binding protein [Candidatus Limnocylindria bacterium]|nr:ATP-binding protein [Candidatus Limnocylindria bacterium]
MTAVQLVQWLTNGLFLLLMVLVVASAARYRSRLAVDAAILFGVLGVTVLQGVVLTALGVRGVPLVGDLVLVAVIALPYLTLRIANDLAPVARWARWSSLAIVGVTAAGAIVAGPTPGWIAVLLAVAFLVLQPYAAWTFWRAARRSAGPMRLRLTAAAAGTLLLGVLIGLAVALQGRPEAPVVTQALSLATAVAYVVGFAPPAILRRAWREPHLRDFLATVAAASSRDLTSETVAELERGIANAMGMESARIVLAEDGGVAIGEDDAVRALTDAAIRARRALLESSPRRAILAAPIASPSRLLGAVVLCTERALAFPDESIALVDLLADQAAVALEGARLRDEARAASQAKTEFLANMSHELRTPLNAILGFSSLLREQPDLAPDRRARYLANISEAGDHLLTLINDVLDLTKVEAGRIELRPDRMSVASLVEPILAAIRSAAAARGVALVADLGRPAVVRVDAQRIRQVLLNLLSNAVKFTPAGGEVRLHVSAGPSDLDLAVADTGIGIPEDRQDRVFGVFERLNEDRSEQSGTGLGLALTKRLVELHGGSIGFESAVERGTVFRVRLPGVVREASLGDRVLIVEDDERDAELVAALAGRCGLRTETVGSVAAALEALARGAPVAVVLDLRLSDGRGEDVLLAIRGDERTRSLPVAVVTVEDDAPIARSLGVSLVVKKPIAVPLVSAWLDRVSRPALLHTATT